MIKNSCTYGMVKVLQEENFDSVKEKVISALQKQGFGILTEINVKETLKKKLDVDFRKYQILGACNPNLAFQVLNVEDHVGLLLPCNVVIQEDNGKVVVSILDPESMFDFLENKEKIKNVVKEAKSRLKKVLEEI